MNLYRNFTTQEEVDIFPAKESGAPLLVYIHGAMRVAPSQNGTWKVPSFKQTN